MANLTEMPDRQPLITLDIEEDFGGLLHTEDILFWLWQNGFLSTREEARLLFDRIEKASNDRPLADFLEGKGSDVYTGLHGIYVYRS